MKKISIMIYGVICSLVGAGAIFSLAGQGIAFTDRPVAPVTTDIENIEALPETVTEGRNSGVESTPTTTPLNPLAISISQPEANGATDRDGDGLSDAYKAKVGTNPLDRDTDNDGFWDGEELDFDLGRLLPTPRKTLIALEAKNH